MIELLEPSVFTEEEKRAVKEYKAYLKWLDKQYQDFDDAIEANLLAGEAEENAKLNAAREAAEALIKPRKGKPFSIINPAGELVTGENLATYCRANNLLYRNMSAVINGQRNHHKGYRATKKGLA